jgi:hypothetical protein
LVLSLLSLLSVCFLFQLLLEPHTLICGLSLQVQLCYHIILALSHFCINFSFIFLSYDIFCSAIYTFLLLDLKAWSCSIWLKTLESKGGKATARSERNVNKLQRNRNCVNTFFIIS